MENFLTFVFDYWYVLLALIIYYFIIAPYWKAYLRQKLFNLRADWFHFAAQGAINFSDPLYVSFRARINDTVRLQNHISLLGCLIMILAVDIKKYLDEDELNQIDLKNYTKSQRDTFEDIQYRAYYYAGSAMLVGSPILTLLLTIIGMIVHLSVAAVTPIKRIQNSYPGVVNALSSKFKTA